MSLPAFINGLPDELLLTVFRLSCGTLEETRTLLAISQVCRRWRLLAHDPFFARLFQRYRDHRSCTLVLAHVHKILASSLPASCPSVIIAGVGAGEQLESLNLEESGLSALPDLSFLTSLRTLSLGNNKFSVPPDVSALTQLRELTLEENILTSIPKMSALESLEELSLEGNQLALGPPLSFPVLPRLQILNLSGNKLATFPDLSLLVELRHLSFGDNCLTGFPNLSGLVQLEYIDFDNNLISRVDKHDLKPLVALEELHLNSIKLRSFPNVRLAGLSTLALKGNKLKTCPDLGSFPGVKCLDLSCNQLTTLVNLEALGELEYLLVSNNSLSELPHFQELPNLLFVNVRNNRQLRGASKSTQYHHGGACTIKF